MTKRQSTKIVVEPEEKPPIHVDSEAADSFPEEDLEATTEDDDDSALDPDGPGASIGEVKPEDETKAAYKQEPVTQVEEPDTTETYTGHPNLTNLPAESDCGAWMESNLLEAFEENGIIQLYTGTGILIGAGHSIQEACHSAGLRAQVEDDDI